MTNYSARKKGKTPKAGNKKDGGSTRRRNAKQDAQFEALGFEMIDWNKWSYTWPGTFPVIKLVPGMVGFNTGWVAITEDGHQVPIGNASPAEIKERLDKIIHYEAELASLPDKGLWVTRPQAAIRQATPACRQLVEEYDISPQDADEILVGRGE